jgi:hypothetical protein
VLNNLAAKLLNSRVPKVSFRIVFSVASTRAAKTVSKFFYNYQLISSVGIQTFCFDVKEADENLDCAEPIGPLLAALWHGISHLTRRPPARDRAEDLGRSS